MWWKLRRDFISVFVFLMVVSVSGDNCKCGCIKDCDWDLMINVYI